MTRTVIGCPHCHKQITLSAHSEFRIPAKEKAVHVHEDLEKEIQENFDAKGKVYNSVEELTADLEVTADNDAQTAFYEAATKEEGKITSPLKEQFEAVMTTYQPRDFFMAVHRACQYLRLYRYPDRNTLQKIYAANEFTQMDIVYILKKYDEVDQRRP